jgi:hypothetical protein
LEAHSVGASLLKDRGLKTVHRLGLVLGDRGLEAVGVWVSFCHSAVCRPVRLTASLRHSAVCAPVTFCASFFQSSAVWKPVTTRAVLPDRGLEAAEGLRLVAPEADLERDMSDGAELNTPIWGPINVPLTSWRTGLAPDRKSLARADPAQIHADHLAARAFRAFQPQTVHVHDSVSPRASHTGHARYPRFGGKSDQPCHTRPNMLVFIVNLASLCFGFSVLVENRSERD